MKLFKGLAFKNFYRKPARSVSLIVLSALLSFSIFAGTMVVSSLNTGLGSLEERLGSDIMVVPYEASTKSSLEDIVLQGNTGYFYMDKSVYDELSNIEGISQISAQFFLSSASAGCCDFAVQIIGFDPETDFTVQPWLKDSKGGELGELEVFVGNDLNAFAGDTIVFYGTKVSVKGKLDKTGTALDTAVYTTNETVKTLIRSAYENQFYDFDFDPDDVVSSVLINVADGYTIEDVLNDINLHVDNVKAVQTKSLVTGVAKSLSGISNIVGILIVAIWILAIIIMIVAFSMIMNERKKEFAIIRVVGASRAKLSGMILKESALISFIGSVIGVALGIICIFPFSNLIQDELDLPFLMPNLTYSVAVAIISVAAATIAGALSSSVSAGRISRMQAGLILRAEN